MVLKRLGLSELLSFLGSPRFSLKYCVGCALLHSRCPLSVTEISPGPPISSRTAGDTVSSSDTVSCDWCCSDDQADVAASLSISRLVSGVSGGSLSRQSRLSTDGTIPDCTKYRQITIYSCGQMGPTRKGHFSTDTGSLWTCSQH